jgi:hypothetical protein
LTQRESKQNEKKEEIIPSPPSAVQRETNIIPADLVAPVDMPRDIAVGHKWPTQAQQTLQEIEEHTSPSRDILRKQKSFFLKLSFSHEPLH